MTASNEKFEKFNAAGVWLNQPFKIRRLGDGKPKPKELRKPLKMSDWPDTLEGNDDVYFGEPFLGPWG